MRTVFIYIVLILGAYTCQTVLYTALLPTQLRVDLLLIMVVHFGFSHPRPRALVLALFLGLLMDVGLPLKGCIHPLFYLAIALLASLLCQNLNLHSRRYQGIFLGLCALVEGGGIWIVLWLQGGKFAEGPYLLQLLGCRAMATALIGPLLSSGMERLDQWVGSLSHLQESQEV